MEKYHGNSIFGGIVIGTISFYRKYAQMVKREHVTDTEAEVVRFDNARKQAIRELRQLYQQAVDKVGEANAAVFDVHTMLLADDDYLDYAYDIIRTEEVNSEFAAAVAGEHFSKKFAMMEEEYFRARSEDIKDISERVIRALSGVAERGAVSGQPCILVADDLSPSETVSLDRDTVLAFVTRLGSPASHTAILARNMNIPALTGIDISERWDGQTAIVDGFRGEFYVNPDEATLQNYRRQMEEEAKRTELLQQLKGQENITLDGKQIQVYANIGNLSDVASVLANDGGGIGLLRSEFLYLDRNSFPTEEEQFEIYRRVAENMAGREVIIRTLDIGADKQLDYFQMGAEDNPALGCRAIRFCFDRPDILKTQLRAILRASMYGTISIMYPMIISVDEIRAVKQMVDRVKQELTDQNIPYRDVEQGIMIETPAAVLISDLLAKEVDFFSIGTNDLTQYTLAVDRQNAKVGRYFNPHHEAILRMIQMTVDNGHKEGCRVGICGELAADLALTKRFLQMGIDELSVSPSMILVLRDKIRTINTEE